MEAPRASLLLYSEDLDLAAPCDYCSPQNVIHRMPVEIEVEHGTAPEEGRQAIGIVGREETKRIRNEYRLKNVLQAMAEDRMIAPYAIQVGQLDTFARVDLFPVEISAIASAGPRRLATFRAGVVVPELP